MLNAGIVTSPTAEQFGSTETASSTTSASESVTAAVASVECEEYGELANSKVRFVCLRAQKHIYEYIYDIKIKKVP